MRTGPWQPRTRLVTPFAFDRASTEPGAATEDTPELNLVLDYYRRALAATAAAVKASADSDSDESCSIASSDEGTRAKDDTTASGFLSKRTAYTPLVLPSASARCMDAVSRLCAGPRRMLCLCSDKVRFRNVLRQRHTV